MLATVFRPAEQKDCRWLWQLRQHPSVAMQSLNPTPIPYRQHCRWYQKLMRAEQRYLDIFIETASDNRLGFIRAEPYENGHILSWAIEPGFQGQGLGTMMLSTWCTTYSGNTLWAHIKSSNVASQAIAARVGFIKIGAEANIDLWRRDFVNQ